GADFGKLLPLDLPAEQEAVGNDLSGLPWMVVRGDDMVTEPSAPPDRLGLFYTGKINMLWAESGAGKSWVAAELARDTGERGEVTLWLDYEQGSSEVAGRLVLLGADRTSLLYVWDPASIDADDIRRTIAALRPDVVIVDAFAGALVSYGFDENSNPDVE